MDAASGDIPYRNALITAEPYIIVKPIKEIIIIPDQIVNFFFSLIGALSDTL